MYKYNTRGLYPYTNPGPSTRAMLAASRAVMFFFFLAGGEATPFQRTPPTSMSFLWAHCANTGKSAVMSPPPCGWCVCVCVCIVSPIPHPPSPIPLLPTSSTQKPPAKLSKCTFTPPQHPSYKKAVRAKKGRVIYILRRRSTHYFFAFDFFFLSFR